MPVQENWAHIGLTAHTEELIGYQATLLISVGVEGSQVDGPILKKISDTEASF